MGKMFLPFILKSLPVRKLALINFDNDPDEVYRRFELQLIGTREDPRIIAYRSDGYVDVYDHIGSEGDDFRSYGKGLHERIRTHINGAVIESSSRGGHIHFEFMDSAGRKIYADADENIRKREADLDMDILAPTGGKVGDPSGMPLFMLLQCELMDADNCRYDIRIGDRRMSPDKPPVSVRKNGRARTLARYSLDCRYYLFAPECFTGSEVEADENRTYIKDGITYKWNADGRMAQITTDAAGISFSPAVGKENSEGKIKIDMESCGSIRGKYESDGEKTVMTFGRWESMPHDIFERIMYMMPLFREWPVYYSCTVGETVKWTNKHE
jgi:hypothetical protein